MSDNGMVPAARYLPHVIAATLLVAVCPVAVAWFLRARGVLSSAWVCAGLAVALSCAAAFAGSAWWQRRRRSGDLMFSELLIWGWLRRLHIEHRLASATELLGLGASGADAGAAAPSLSVQRSGQLLRQLASALEAQDSYTVGHSRRVARHARTIATRLGLPCEDVACISAAAAVHDIGKLRVPRSVLDKPGRLTDAEFEAIKRHPDDGAAMVSCLGDAKLTAIVRHHHERLDGTGYPAGLVAEQIPIGARIVAVADTFDAIVSTRPYRPAAPHKRAIDVLAGESGVQFDPLVVHAFLSQYSGSLAVALWSALAVAPQTAFAWPHARSGVRRPTSGGQKVVTAGALAALAAVALAAPGAPKHRQPYLPMAAIPVLVPAPPAAAKPHVRVAAAHSASVGASVVCQAYNPQLCASLAGPGGVTATDAANVTATDAADVTAADAANVTAGASAAALATQVTQRSGGALPFTGVDLVLVALVAIALVALGLVMRRLAQASD